MSAPLIGIVAVGGSIPAALSEAISELWLPAEVEVAMIDGCDDGTEACPKGM